MSENKKINQAPKTNQSIANLQHKPNNSYKGVSLSPPIFQLMAIPASENKTVQREEDDNKAMSGLEANTLFDIWQGNVQVAKNNFTNAIKPEGPPPGKALFDAILAIGIDVTAGRLFGPLIDGVSKAGQKAIYEILQGAYKEGTKATANALVNMGGGKLKIAPKDFANQWQSDQIVQINKGRAKLLDLIRNKKITGADMAALAKRVKGNVLSAQTATQILVQQYSHALYYNSGDKSFDADGLVDITLAYGSGMNGNSSDLKDGKPYRCSVEINGYDTKALSLLASTYPDGIDPVKMGMAFRIHLFTFKQQGITRGGWDKFVRSDHSLYFNNGGKLNKGDDEAKTVMQQWGGTVPIVKTWGTKQSVVGFSKKVI